MEKLNKTLITYEYPLSEVASRLGMSRNTINDADLFKLSDVCKA